MPRARSRRRPGAPPGNLNALKHGLRSQQFAQLGAILAQDPTIRQALLGIAKRHNLKRRRANEVAALLFTMLFERANQIANGQLNVQLPTHDWRTIQKTAEKLTPDRYAPGQKEEKTLPNNCPADTNRRKQRSSATGDER